MVVDMRDTWSSVALQQDRSVLDLFSTTTVVVNAELASLYGLEASGMDSQSFVELALPDDGPRAGILSKAGFLSQFAIIADTIAGDAPFRSLELGVTPATPNGSEDSLQFSAAARHSSPDSIFSSYCK